MGPRASCPGWADRRLRLLNVATHRVCHTPPVSSPPRILSLLGISEPYAGDLVSRTARPSARAMKIPVLHLLPIDRPVGYKPYLSVTSDRSGIFFSPPLPPCIVSIQRQHLYFTRHDRAAPCFSSRMHNSRPPYTYLPTRKPSPIPMSDDGIGVRLHELLHSTNNANISRTDCYSPLGLEELEEDSVDD